MGANFRVVKLVLFSPASDAIGEHTFSTARRIKTWLRLICVRFNNLKLRCNCLKNICKEKTDLIDLITIVNEFASGNDSRKKNFITSADLLHEYC